MSDADLVTKTFKEINDELGPVTGLVAVRILRANPRLCVLTTFPVERRCFGSQACAGDDER